MHKATDKVRGCVVLDRKTTVLVDDYRRKQPAIPTRRLRLSYKVGLPRCFRSMQGQGMRIGFRWREKAIAREERGQGTCEARHRPPKRIPWSNPGIRRTPKSGVISFSPASSRS